MSGTEGGMFGPTGIVQVENAFPAGVADTITELILAGSSPPISL
jgi:hypothetical protein